MSSGGNTGSILIAFGDDSLSLLYNPLAGFLANAVRQEKKSVCFLAYLLLPIPESVCCPGSYLWSFNIIPHRLSAGRCVVSRGIALLIVSTLSPNLFWKFRLSLWITLWTSNSWFHSTTCAPSKDLQVDMPNTLSSLSSPVNLLFLSRAYSCQNVSSAQIEKPPFHLDVPSWQQSQHPPSSPARILWVSASPSFHTQLCTEILFLYC